MDQCYSNQGCLTNASEERRMLFSCKLECDHQSGYGLQEKFHVSRGKVIGYTLGMDQVRN